MIQGSCHCGSVFWECDKTLDHVTACNCTLCRRYGALWGYDYEDEAIRVEGPTSIYIRADGGDIGFHFCARCGCLLYWRSRQARPDGRRRLAVNVRMAEPEVVGDIPIRHFDGLDTFGPLPSDGRCVADYWF